MLDDLNRERLKRYTAAKAQALLKEHGQFLEDISKEVISEYNQEINEDTADKVLIKYSQQQGARMAMLLFMRKLSGRANE